MNDNAILKLLGSVNAHEDPAFLSYYVRRVDLMESLLDENRAFTIINSPRGSGKSGLLIAMEDKLSKLKKYCTIRKLYYDVQFPEGHPSINQYINFWKNTLLGWIVENIGNQMGFAWTDDDITAVEVAEKTGSKAKNVLTAVMSRLKVKALPIEKLEYDTSLTPEQSLRIVKSSPLVFWLLLDEMDDFYEDTEEVNNRLVSLMQACNVLASLFPNIKVRLTIRPHIMTVLKCKNEKVQTYWQNELSIAWKTEELKEVLARRIQFFEDADFENQVKLEMETQESDESRRSTLIARYFDDFDMSFKADGKTNYRALTTLSFGRPRWMLEFCHLALRNAEKGRATKISFQKAMHDYGHNRITFIIGEFNSQFPDVKAVINSFASKRKLIFGTSSMLKAFIIDEVLNSIYTTKTKPSSIEREAYALAIANSLYVMEFIRPRQSWGGHDDHRFIYYTERPELMSTWPQSDDLEWHIHPAYAKALTIDQNYTFRKGAGVADVGLIGEAKKRKKTDYSSWTEEVKKLEKLYTEGDKAH